MTLPFDHTHDLDPGVEISRSESEIALSQEWDGRLTWNEKDVSHPFMTTILTSLTMVGWADVPDSDWGDIRRRRAVDISSFQIIFGLIKYDLVREKSVKSQWNFYCLAAGDPVACFTL